MARRISQETALRRFQIQALELEEIRNKCVSGGGMNAIYTDYVTCQGTQPGRLSGEGHKSCGERTPMAHAYKCLYCGYWFCAACAEIHFGKTREQFKAEQLEKEARRG